MTTIEFIKITTPLVNHEIEQFKKIEEAILNGELDNQMFKKLDILPKSKSIHSNIIYINGVGNDYTAAENNKNRVKTYFDGHSVNLLHNPTKKLLDDRIGVLGDLPECVVDYKWAMKIANNIVDDPIINNTTFKTIAVLQVAMERNLPLGILGSSQGALISYNAILAFAKLNKLNTDYLKECVRVCHIGTVIPANNTSIIKSKVNKYKTAVNKKDPIAKIIGLQPNIQSALWPLIRANIKYHYVEYYLPTDLHVFEYYSKKTELNEFEPFISKDFFTNPKMEISTQKETSSSNNSNDWLIPLLNIMQ